MKNKHLVNVVKAALFAALTCVCTMLIAIPIPGGTGFINIGDVMVTLCGVFCGPVYGFFAAALGSALADALAGYVVYAPATFLIKGIMALTVALLIKTNVKYIIVPAAFLAEAEMLGGYFLFELFLYGISAAGAGFMGNLIQGSACLVISVAAVFILTANKHLKRLTY